MNIFPKHFIDYKLQGCFEMNFPNIWANEIEIIFLPFVAKRISCSHFPEQRHKPSPTKEALEIWKISQIHLISTVLLIGKSIDVWWRFSSTILCLPPSKQAMNRCHLLWTLPTYAPWPRWQHKMWGNLLKDQKLPAKMMQQKHVWKILET